MTKITTTDWTGWPGDLKRDLTVVGAMDATRRGQQQEDAELAKALALPDLVKSGGPFVGPRGGKWADAKHTIPWDEPGGDRGHSALKERLEGADHGASIVANGRVHQKNEGGSWDRVVGSKKAGTDSAHQLATELANENRHDLVLALPQKGGQSSSARLDRHGKPIGYDVEKLAAAIKAETPAEAKERAAVYRAAHEAGGDEDDARAAWAKVLATKSKMAAK